MFNIIYLWMFLNFFSFNTNNYNYDIMESNKITIYSNSENVIVDLYNIYNLIYPNSKIYVDYDNVYIDTKKYEYEVYVIPGFSNNILINNNVYYLKDKNNLINDFLLLHDVEIYSYEETENWVLIDFYLDGSINNKEYLVIYNRFDYGYLFYILTFILIVEIIFQKRWYKNEY